MTPSRRLRICVVAWSGSIGGGEAFAAALAPALRRRGIDAGMVFVTSGRHRTDGLRSAGVPVVELGLRRGRQILWHARRLRRAVELTGADGALVLPGYMAGTLCLAGYRGAIVAVEHGTVLQLPRLSPPARLVRRLDFLSGAWAPDAEVAVSDVVLRRLAQRPARRPRVRIHHGLELDRYEPAPPPPRDGELIAGALARLIPGKGLATLIEALGRLGPNPGVRLRIGGEGPDRDRLERLAAALPAGARVELVGPVHDPPAFWRGCHVGVAPSDGWIESFGLSPLEAMAVGRPVIVSRAGGLPEVVGDGTGILVEPGDAGQLAAALARYRDDPELAAAHGGAGRERCERAFSMERCAAEYAELFRRLCPRPGRMLVPAGWRGARPFDLAPLAPDTETVEA